MTASKNWGHCQICDKELTPGVEFQIIDGNFICGDCHEVVVMYEMSEQIEMIGG